LVTASWLPRSRRLAAFSDGETVEGGSCWCWVEKVCVDLTMAESIGPVKMDGPVSGLEFRSMVGVEQVSQPFRYDVEFLSDIDALEPTSFLGEPMTVHLEMRDRTLRHFNGIITEFSLRGHVGQMALYAVTLRPRLWLLTQRINSKIHKGTAVQIVKAVLADAPYAATKLEVQEGPLDDVEQYYEFVVQHEESDFNFVMRVLERDGIYFYFEHSTDKHSLVLTTSDAYTVEKYGTLEFTVAADAPEKQQEHIDQFVRHSALTPGTFAIHDFDYTATTNPLLVEVAMPRAHPLGEFEVFHFPGGYVATDFGRAIARRRLEALQVAAERFEGQGNARCLGAGQLFSLVGHPEARSTRTTWSIR
jgi:type VI secretion system secreted protein VgrG